jgi:hypothetical protein
MKPSTRPKSTARPPSETQVDCIDGLQDCLETIGALAGLLEAAGREGALLDNSIINHTGKLILLEVAKADAWLDKLEEATAR